MKQKNEVKILFIVASIVVAISVIIYIFVSPEKTVDMNVTANLLTGQDNFSVGTKEAKVTVVEYFDPECETCAKVSPYIKTEINYYKEKVRWVFRYMAYHPNSLNAIRILEAARKQNLYFGSNVITS